jgi:hypothetical protein
LPKNATAQISFQMHTGHPASHFACKNPTKKMVTFLIISDTCTKATNCKARYSQKENVMRPLQEEESLTIQDSKETTSMKFHDPSSQKIQQAMRSQAEDLEYRSFHTGASPMCLQERKAGNVFQERTLTK